ncbi:MAG: molybdate ABC transporter permease subunit [Actinobacteria bacterium]|nr:molybdate ABC transporter permease subunit [Actinomycetota bacterium]
MARRKLDSVNITLATVATLLLVLPLLALFTKVPWATILSRLTERNSISAIRLSLWSSLLAALICVVLGVPLAWVLARGNSRLTNILRPLVLAPMVLPPTVAGMSLLALLGREGLLGRYIYQATGWSMPFTTSAVVLTGVFVGMPFLALVAESTFRHLPRDQVDAAQIDRATPFKLFWRIAIPQARNGIATGAVLAWARALGEFGATMMFAGSLPGLTQTWPMQVYFAADQDMGTAYALSAGMALVAFLVVYSLRKQLRQAFSS